MILDLLLSQSPVFLFVVSALLLAAYGVGRFVQACMRHGRRWLSQHPR